VSVIAAKYGVGADHRLPQLQGELDVRRLRIVYLASSCPHLPPWDLIVHSHITNIDRDLPTCQTYHNGYRPPTHPYS
jgi:hypothetical protein